MDGQDGQLFVSGVVFLRDGVEVLRVHRLWKRRGVGEHQTT